MEVLDNPQRQAGIREVIQVLHEALANATLLSSEDSRYSTRGDVPDLAWGISPNLPL